MEHYDNDILYKYVLEVLDSGDSETIKTHLEDCDDCSNKIFSIKREMDLLSSYKPNIELTRLKNKKAKDYNFSWFRAAAVLFIGLFIGYSASNYLTVEKTVVVGQTLIPQYYMMDTLKFAICPNVDLNTTY